MTSSKKFTFDSAENFCLIILPANGMITQLQKLWKFYYIPNHYGSVLFRSLQYYRPGLIIWLEQWFLTFFYIS